MLFLLFRVIIVVSSKFSVLNCYFLVEEKLSEFPLCVCAVHPSVSRTSFLCSSWTFNVPWGILQKLQNWSKKIIFYFFPLDVGSSPGRIFEFDFLKSFWSFQHALRRLRSASVLRIRGDTWGAWVEFGIFLVVLSTLSYHDCPFFLGSNCYGLKNKRED